MAVTRCRLLCTECGGLQRLKAIEGHSALLVCGHSRPRKLLPLAQGCISVENVKSAIGDNLFPKDYNATRLDRWRLT
jgi:hypothetical protein